MFATTATNNVMQNPVISPIMMNTTTRDHQGDLDKDVEDGLSTIPELSYIMAFLVVQGHSGAPTER